MIPDIRVMYVTQIRDVEQTATRSRCSYPNPKDDTGYKSVMYVTQMRDVEQTATRSQCSSPNPNDDTGYKSDVRNTDKRCRADGHKVTVFLSQSQG